MISVRVSGGGKGRHVEVDDVGALSVVTQSHPPLNEPVIQYPFTQFLTDDGTSSGSSDMAIDGATTPTEFFIGSSNDYDIFIKQLSVVIGDGGSPALNLYGSLSPLTNGVEWFYFNQDLGRRALFEPFKTNLSFNRAGSKTAAIGTGVDAFLADVSGGGTEKSYLPRIDTEDFFAIQYGLRIRKGSTDRIGFKVRDDLTGLTTHNIIASGSLLIAP